MAVRIASIVVVMLFSSEVFAQAPAPTPPASTLQKLQTLPDRVTPPAPGTLTDVPIQVPSDLRDGDVTVEQFAAMRKAIQDAGLPVDDSHFLMTGDHPGYYCVLPDGRCQVEFTLENGRLVLHTFYAPRVSGFFAPWKWIVPNVTVERSVLEDIEEPPLAKPPTPTPIAFRTPTGYSNVSTLTSGGFGGGGGIENMRLNFTRNLEVVNGQIGGVAIPEQRNTAVPTGQTISLRLTHATAPRISIPLGTRRNTQGHLTFGHNLTGTFGGAIANLDFTDGVDATEWQGHGFQWSASYNALVRACGSCPFDITGSIEHSRIRINGMTTDPIDVDGLRTNEPEGDFLSQVIAGGVGVSLRQSRVTIMAGINVERRSASLTGRAILSGNSPAPLNLNLSFENELDNTQGVVAFGSQFHLGERYRLGLGGRWGARSRFTLSALFERAF